MAKLSRARWRGSKYYREEKGGSWRDSNTGAIYGGSRTKPDLKKRLGYEHTRSHFFGHGPYPKGKRVLRIPIGKRKK